MSYVVREARVRSPFMNSSIRLGYKNISSWACEFKAIFTKSIHATFLSFFMLMHNDVA